MADSTSKMSTDTSSVSLTAPSTSSTSAITVTPQVMPLNTAATTFSPFPRLPKELQFKIWSQAFIDLPPKVIEISVRSGPDMYLIRDLSFKVRKDRAFLKLIQACQASRNLITHNYECLSFPDDFQGEVDFAKHTAVDWERDIIFIRSGFWDWYNFLLATRNTNVHEHCRHMALPSDTFLRPFYLNNNVGWADTYQKLRNLETLTVIFTEDYVDDGREALELVDLEEGEVKYRDAEDPEDAPDCGKVYEFDCVEIMLREIYVKKYREIRRKLDDILRIHPTLKTTRIVHATRKDAVV